MLESDVWYKQTLAFLAAHRPICLYGATHRWCSFLVRLTVWPIATLIVSNHQTLYMPVGVSATLVSSSITRYLQQCSTFFVSKEFSTSSPKSKDMRLRFPHQTSTNNQIYPITQGFQGSINSSDLPSDPKIRQKSVLTDSKLYKTTQRSRSRKVTSLERSQYKRTDKCV